MKYYTENANLERSMNQILYKTDFAAKKCQFIILHKKSNRYYLFPYTEVVNDLPSFLTRTSKNGKNLLVSFSIVNLMLECLGHTNYL